MERGRVPCEKWGDDPGKAETVKQRRKSATQRRLGPSDTGEADTRREPDG
jgi:hypothetical protein